MVEYNGIVRNSSKYNYYANKTSNILIDFSAYENGIVTNDSTRNLIRIGTDVLSDTEVIDSLNIIKDIYVKINWTAETCFLSYTIGNGSTFKLGGICPYGWTYGSEFDTTVLSEVGLLLKYCVIIIMCIIHLKN